MKVLLRRIQTCRIKDFTTKEMVSYMSHISEVLAETNQNLVEIESLKEWLDVKIPPSSKEFEKRLEKFKNGL